MEINPDIPSSVNVLEVVITPEEYSKQIRNPNSPLSKNFALITTVNLEKNRIRDEQDRITVQLQKLEKLIKSYQIYLQEMGYEASIAEFWESIEETYQEENEKKKTLEKQLKETFKPEDMERLKDLADTKQKLIECLNKLKEYQSKLSELPQQQIQAITQSLEKSHIDNLISIKDKEKQLRDDLAQKLSTAGKELDKLLEDNVSPETIAKKKEEIEQLKYRDSELTNYIEETQHLFPDTTDNKDIDVQEHVRSALEKEKQEKRNTLDKLLQEESINISEQDKFKKELNLMQIQMIRQLRLEGRGSSIRELTSEANKEIDKISKQFEDKALALQKQIEESKAEIDNLDQHLTELSTPKETNLERASPAQGPLTEIESKIKGLEQELQIQKDSLRANRVLANSVLGEGDLKFHAQLFIMSNGDARKQIFGDTFQPPNDKSPVITLNDKGNYAIQWGETKIENVDVGKLKIFAGINISNGNKPIQEKISQLEKQINDLKSSSQNTLPPNESLKDVQKTPLEIQLKNLENDLMLNQDAIKANKDLANSVLGEGDLKFHAQQNLSKNKEARDQIFGTDFEPTPNTSPVITKKENNTYDVQWGDKKVENIDVDKLKNFARNNILNMNKPYQENITKLEQQMKELFDNTRDNYKKHKDDGDIVVNMNNLIALAKAREALFKASPKASKEYEDEMRKKAGLSDRHSKVGDFAKDALLGLAGVNMSVAEYRGKKESSFETKQEAKKFQDTVLADPAMQKMVEFFKEKGMTSMKAVPGVDGKPPYIQFKGKDPDREIRITCGAKGQPKGIATPKDDSANVDFFASSLQKLIEVQTKNNKAPPYKVKGDQKPLDKFSKIVNGEHDKYGKDEVYKKLLDIAENSTVKEKIKEKPKEEKEQQQKQEPSSTQRFRT